MSDPSTIGAMLHGPGGLLSTPGTGSRRQRRRKWGQRLKAKQIVGNLYRGDTGKFQAGGASTPSGATPKRGDVLSKQPAPSARPKPDAVAKPKKGGGGKGRTAPKPKAPKRTPAERQQARDTAHAAAQTANRDAVKQAMADQDAGLAPKGFDNLIGLAGGKTPDQAGADGLVKMGMAEIGGDGTLRLTESGRAAVNAANRGDAKAAIDAVSRGSDQSGKRSAAEQKRTEADAKRAAAAAKKLEPKPAKAAASGGGGKKPDKPDKAAERTQRAAETAGQIGMAAPDLSALRTATEAGGVTNDALSKLGLVGSDGLATDQGRRALLALERGDVRQYNAALQDAAARMDREQGARDRTQQTESKRTQAAADRAAKQQRQVERLKRRALGGAKMSDAQIGQLQDAGVIGADGRWTTKAETYGGTKRVRLDDSVFAGPDRSFPIVTTQDVRNAVASLGRTKHDKAAVKRGIIRRAHAIGATDALPEDWKAKSFVVFKDATGNPRWIARTTTAYRDRDKEIISEAALDADSKRMTTTKQFGPLRYWHVGQPDPFDERAPWGPGLDIGDCDYSSLIGRTRLESGTFRDAHIARSVARKQAQYELSPGFFHPLDQPDSGGVFSAIRTFERSIVPIRYGRASNLFTGMAVKESRMDIDEMEKRFKTAIVDLGLDKDQALALGAQLVATEKDATTQGIAFKSDDTPPDDYPDLEINGVVYKAFPPKAADEPPMEEAAKADAPPIVDETVVDESPEAEMAGDYIGDMSWDEFASKLSELLAPVLKMQDMVKAMGDAHQELKGMYGGVATKDDARAAELAALKSALADLTSKIAQIEGDQPATILPDDVAEALKSAGPAKPAEPERASVTQAINDPTRPFAGWGAQTFPELYQNGEPT